MEGDLLAEDRSAVVLVTTVGHTTVVTINRPEKRNAYDASVRQAMAEAFAEFDARPDQHVAIVTGAGDAAFCSGADLTALVDRPEPPRPYPMTDMFGVGATSKPVIAAVNGLAVGGGCEIALAADIRIASEAAWFGLFEPKRGIIPGVATQLLPRMIAYGDAAMMLLSARRVDAEEALRIGLVQRVVSADSLMAEAINLAEEISQLSQYAVRTIKSLMRSNRDLLLRETLALGREMQKLVMLSPDVAEGMTAFAEKRAPVFGCRSETDESVP